MGLIIELRVMQASIEEKLFAHTNYELFLVLSGDAYITDGQATTHIKRDELYFVNSNVKHKCKITDDSILLSFLISYQDAYKIIGLPYIQFNVSPVAGKVEWLTQLRKLLKEIVALSMRGTTLDNIRMQSLYHEVLHILVEHFSNWTPSQVDNITLSRENRLQMISDYIINNYQQQLSLEQLADQLDLSVPYLSKYIKRELGMGFVQYLNNIRLYHAVDDLTQSNRPITQIAYDNGFTNLTSFNRLFKATYNCSPSDHRKKNKQQHDVNVKMEVYTTQILSNLLAKNPFTLLEETGKQSIRVNLTMEDGSSSYNKNWNKLLAFGAANRILDSSIQEHILTLCKNLGFTNLRIWGLFSEENSIDKNSLDKFNFTKLNQIFDFLYNNALVPHIDLGFQAEEIYGGLEETIHYKETDIEFTELGQYNRLLSQFLKNAINRYGMDYVNQWKFEMWKDPRLLFENDPVTFFTVFDVAYEAIKNILPEAQVGGCGLKILGSISDFEKSLNIWSKRIIKPDFFTVTLYPYHRSSNGRKELSQDEDYFYRSIGRLKEIMGTYGMEEKPLYINAWNVTRSNRNSINDSCYKAAYIVRNTIQCLKQVDSMAYYGSTDLLNEHFDTTSILSGGVGMLTKDGIKKPAFYAYHFLNRLGSRLLSYGENYIATQDHDDIILLCHNCVQPDLDYYLYHKDDVKPTEVASLFEDRKINLMFSIAQVTGKCYMVKKYWLNDRAGSIMNTWIHAGMTEIADKEEIQYFKSMCIPHLSSGILETQNFRLNFKTELDSNEIQLIHFKLQE